MLVGKSTLDDLPNVTLSACDLTPEVFARIHKAGRVAWDIETNGLDPTEAEIGTCQLYSHGVGAYVVTRISERPPLLSSLLESSEVTKVFHHAPFDLSFMAYRWGVTPRSVACTKIAAKLLDTNADTNAYSLKYLMKRHFNVTLHKEMRFTNWMASSLTEQQLEYAVGDVARLLDLYDLLCDKLRDQELTDLYEECCSFLPSHVRLKLHGCPDPFKY